MSPSDTNKKHNMKGLSRRDFLQTAGIATLAVGSGSISLTPKPARSQESTTETIKPGGPIKPKPYNVLLVLTDQERYLPEVITELEEVLEEHGLRHDAITIRMTGCPNGCGRPFLAEIGIVGRGPGRYNIYLGAGHAGQRLNKLWKADVTGGEIKDVLAPVIGAYAKERNEGEHFGDFVIRAGFVAETTEGRTFHEDSGAREPALT